jgi:RecA-family ATPase
MISLSQLAHVLGGEVSAGQVLAPSPGHSAADRGMAVKIDADAPGGFLVKLFNEGDEIAAKDYVRSKLGMPAWSPGLRGRGHDNQISHASPGTQIANALAEIRAASAPPKLSVVSSTPIADRIASVPLTIAAATEVPAVPGVAASYSYTDAAGVMLYEVLRLVPKKFVQRRPDGNGGYVYKLDGVERVLYRLPELLKFPYATVFVVEGEKDVGNVEALGLCCTTISGGSAWTPKIAAPLAGRDVVILLDNDAPGYKKAQAAAQALHSVAKSVRLVLLPELEDKGDVSDWLAAGHTKDELEEVCLAAAVWTPAGVVVVVPDQHATIEPLVFVDISTWRVGHGVPPREWGVADLLPKRNVALLSGEGAAGKTLLALQLGIAHALGRDWIGTLPEPGPFLYFGAEDETDEIHRRLADILNFYGADFPDLEGKVYLLTFAGEDAVLGHADHTGIVKPTPLFLRLLAAAIEIKPIMICLDTSADVFAGNENDRSQVRQFVGMLRKLAIQADAYVIVNSHPSLTGISTGTGLSGSTGWHNSVRARMYLTTAKTEKDEEPDPSLRMLEFKKSNYGPVSKAIALRWDQGVYKTVAGIDSLDKMAAEQNADRLFVALLDRFNDQGRNVSEKGASKNYAPTVFSKEAEAKKYGIKKGDFEGAMRRLFAASEISVQSYGAPSRGTTRLVTR